MKRFMWSGVAALLFISLSSSAFATAALELVSGTSTLYVSDNGAVVCTGPACGSAIFPATDSNVKVGAITLAGVTFDGFDLTVTTGGSNSPNCSGLNGPGCINTTNITATNISSGTATLSAYFADTGFAPGGATGLIVGFSTPGETGTTAIQTAYATSGAVNPLASGNLTPTAGAAICGAATLTISGPTANTSQGTGCAAPGSPFSLEIGTTMTADAGGAFNLNGTISAVPEPASVALFGAALALCATGLRRRKVS